jgi:hypothetical protein
LLPQHPILLAEAIDGIPLLLAQSTGDRDQPESERVEGPAHRHRIAANTLVTRSASCTIGSRWSFWTLRRPMPPTVLLLFALHAEMALSQDARNPA